MLKTAVVEGKETLAAYHLGEGRVLKTSAGGLTIWQRAYHLGEGRVLKTPGCTSARSYPAYHLGEGRVLKT